MFRYALAYQRSGGGDRIFLAAGTSAGLEMAPQDVGFATDNSAVAMAMVAQDVGMMLDQQEVAMNDGTEI